MDGYRTICTDPSEVCMYFMVKPLFMIIICTVDSSKINNLMMKPTAEEGSNESHA